MDNSLTRFTRLSLLKTNFSKDNILFLKGIENRLSRDRVPSAHYEAESLVRHFGLMNRLEFFTGEKSLSLHARRTIERALKARLQGMPLSYLLKESDFFGTRFFVTKDTLIPRLETEGLVAEAIKILEKMSSPPKILDIGTGSGCIAVCLTMAKPGCRMTALDISSKALKIARKNIDFHGLRGKIKLLKSDLFEGLSRKEERSWDMIVSNPPYIPKDELRDLPKEVLSEPKRALDGGPEGLAVIHRLLAQSPLYLKKGGWLLVEIGKGQARPLAKKILKEKVFVHLRFIKDYAGIDRILVAQHG